MMPKYRRLEREDEKHENEKKINSKERKRRSPHDCMGKLTPFRVCETYRNVLFPGAMRQANGLILWGPTLEQS